MMKNNNNIFWVYFLNYFSSPLFQEDEVRHYVDGLTGSCSPGYGECEILTLLYQEIVNFYVTAS